MTTDDNMKDNPRLADMLAAVAKISAARKKRKAKAKKKHNDGRFTSESASAARRKYLAENPKVATTCTRVHKDAVALAHTAWPKSDDRIVEVSAAVRERASKALGVKLT